MRHARIQTTQGPWSRPIAFLAALLLAASAAVAEPSEGILEEVQAMLEAGMSEPIIVQWLDGSEEKPRRPSAAELIGLKKAGASDELLAKLLELAAKAPAAPEPPAAPAAPTAPDAPTPATPPAAVEQPVAIEPPNPVTPTIAPAPADTPPVANAAGEVPVYFEVTYLPEFDDEDEWSLYLYIDGKPLTYVPTGTILNSRTLRFREFLPPGAHTLRVAQEQHVQRKRDRWEHAARMSALELPLTLHAGERADVKLTYRHSKLYLRHSEGPLTYRLVQGRSVQMIEKQGGDPENWILVCEEIEANAENGELKRAQRSLLDDCVRWPELWKDPEVPTRQEVREALEMFLYRPISKDQPVD